VLLFVRASLDPIPVSLKYNGVKCNVVSARLGAVTPSLVICSAYRPPDTDTIESEQLRQYIASIRLISDDLIVAGDFNYPHINRTKSTATRRDEVSDEFQAMTEELALTQIVNQPTLGSSFLDIVLTSQAGDVISCDTLPPIASSDHSAVLVRQSVNLEASGRKEHTHTVNFDYVDLQSVAQELSSINWQMAFGGMVQVNDLVTVFMRILYAALHRALLPPRRRFKRPQLPIDT
jgi:hypothetical protein